MLQIVHFLAQQIPALFAAFLLVQIGANVQRVIGVDCAFVKFDVLDNSLFVYNDVRALRPLIGLTLFVVSLQDAVVLEHLLVHFAKERKLDVDLLGESCVCRGRIHAYTKDCSIVEIDLTGSESSLDRLKLLRSTTGEGENVYGEKDIFLAVEVGKLDGLPFVAEQIEIGCLVADFESCFSDLVVVLGMKWCD